MVTFVTLEFSCGETLVESALKPISAVYGKVPLQMMGVPCDT